MTKLPPIEDTIRSLFDSMGLPSLPPLPTIGEDRRDEGIQRVTDNGESWHDRALEKISRLLPGEPFDSDALHHLMGDDKPHHPNSFGAAVTTASKKGLIGVVGFKKSKRPEAHARRILHYIRKP